jgi:hypothetical protein
MSKQQAARNGKVQATTHLQVSSLHAPARGTATKPSRNIFAAGAQALSVESQSPRLIARRKKVSPTVVEVATVPAAPSGPTPEEKAEQAAKEQRELKLKQLKEQMAQYRYVGYLSQDGDRKAFLGKGHEIYIIRQGDKLDGKFQVAIVEPSMVKIRDTDSALETTIRLKKEGPDETS